MEKRLTETKGYSIHQENERKWNSGRTSVYCFILGANPPWDVVEGFIYRVWAKFDVDKVAFLPNGIFLVRFKSEQSKNAVLQQGHFLFDNKPLIVKPWFEGVELVKDDVKVVPVWVKLMNLPLKFWGNCLPRLADLLCKFLRCDYATQEKTRLGFARILIELPFGGKIPESIKFLDEAGNVVVINVVFEWKPALCSTCKGIGHEALACRRNTTQKRTTKRWVPKQSRVPLIPVQPQAQVPIQAHPQVPVQGHAQVRDSPVVSSTPEEIPHHLSVVWEKEGAYRVAMTPPRPVVRLSRHELVATKKSTVPTSTLTFLEALNNITPRVGIGTIGSALPPPGVMHRLGFWNIRGLNGPSKQKHIKYFLHSQRIGLFGLLETKVKPSSLNSVRLNICDNWCVSTNTQYHKGGRVWVLWDPKKVHVLCLMYDAQYIHMEVTDLSTSVKYFCTFIYAFNSVQERKALWAALIDIANGVDGPWLIVGDFNCVLSPLERLGGKTSDEEMNDFQECIDRCGLLTIPSSGSFFTWNNKQGPESRIFSRLDRALGNKHWLVNMEGVYAHFHNEGIFDHTPCTIQSTTLQTATGRSFKYYNMWSAADDFLPCVMTGWRLRCWGTKMYCLTKKLKNLKQPLKMLNKQLYDDIENNSIRAGLYLDYVQTQLKKDPSSVEWCHKELNAAKTYRELKVACDSFLRQKSKVHWVMDGDDNTRYFHNVLKARYVQNTVCRINDMNGFVCSTVPCIQNAFLEYYQMLLGTTEECVPVTGGNFFSLSPMRKSGGLFSPFLFIRPRVRMVILAPSLETLGVLWELK
ncbi:hypothetical protein RND81_12G094100 [Saponaria officinalis]|uniref:DUF4283 domain-containing protein n=1 Tax=Saponaria officinalis TaxID=3572 RepID=A0AAW1H8H6_SAPOF